MNREVGKGDAQRPLGIDKEKFDKNWDNIFNKQESNISINVDVENQEITTKIEVKYEF